MKNNVVAYFEVNPDLQYPVVLGSTYVLNRNEEIDSFNIVIDGIPAVNRLNLKQYQFVKIVVLDDDGFKWNNQDHIFMLVDTFVEHEVDIFKHIYKYEITLMNCVKYLEKFQTSNLMITHNLVGGSNSIYYYIDKYMRLFSPKVKKSVAMTGNTTWEYDYLFDWSGLDRSPFNDTICADMQINEQTLRNVITTLMLQVGCIPTMNYLTLSYINLREKPKPFIKYDDMANIDTSGASDSYANTLVSSPSQILDSENLVTTDCIGFRDSQNVLLHQDENLKLETRFPIYNVKKVFMHRGTSFLIYADSKQFDGTDLQLDKITLWPVVGTARGHGTYAFIDSWERNPNPFIFWSERKIKINFVYPYSHYGYNEVSGKWAHKCKIKNIKIHFCSFVSNKYVERVVISSSDGIEWNLNLNNTSSSVYSDFDNGRTGRSFAQEMKSDGTLGTLIDSADDNTNDYLQNLVYGSNDNGCFCYYTYLSFTNDEKDLIAASKYAWIEYQLYDEVDEKWYNGFVPMCIIYDIEEDDEIVNKSLISFCFKSGSLRSEINTNGLDTYLNPSTTGGYPIEAIEMKAIRPVSGGYGADITKLVVENNKRQLLDSNYLEMQNETTIEGIAKYTYGTVSYQIGGKEITGFSEKYSWSVGWWQQSRTYLDNILEVIENNGLEMINYDDMPVHLRNLYENFSAMPIINDNLYPLGDASLTTTNKGELLFDITYQPINSYKKRYAKEQDYDITIPVEQLNNSENGLSDNNRFGKFMQDTVDRIGNPVKTIQQTTNDLSHINDVNTILDDKYIIFQRSISIFENYIQIQYVASEKYVMQNYFTTIVTKYRAYQNVGYSESIIRKENVTVFCMIAHDRYFNGCDSVIVNGNKELFLSGCIVYEPNIKEENSIKYVVEKSKNDDVEDESVKNEISILADSNSFTIISQDYDNVSAGQYLISTTVNASVGGTAQQWQMWQQSEFNERHNMYYVSQLGENVLVTKDDIDDMKDVESLIDQLPLIPDSQRQAAIDAINAGLAELNTKGIYNVKNYPIISNSYNSYIKLILRNNFDGYKYYWKDYAEVINQSLSFVFYSPNNDIKFTKNFFKHCQLVNQKIENPNYLFGSENFDLTDDLKQIDGRTLISSNISDYIKIGHEDNFAYIEVDWTQLTSYEYIVLSYMEYRSTNQYYKDYIAFKRNDKTDKTKYYLSFNDTKTDKVLYPTDSGLFDKVPVKNGWNRNL